MAGSTEWGMGNGGLAYRGSQGWAGIFPHPSAAARRAVWPQPTRTPIPLVHRTAPSSPHPLPAGDRRSHPGAHALRPVGLSTVPQSSPR